MPNQSQKPVDIGGQAVLEGVMMKGPDAIAITVRRPDKTMVVDYKKSEPLSKKHKWMGLPIIRGAVNMVNMLAMGMTTLDTSAKMLGTEDQAKWLFGCGIRVIRAGGKVRRGTQRSRQMR